MLDFRLGDGNRMKWKNLNFLGQGLDERLADSKQNKTPNKVR